MSKLDEQLRAGVRARRRPEDITAAVATTIIGRMGDEVAKPELMRLDEIAPSRYQSRGAVDAEYLEVLTDSIGAEGLLNPVVVRPLPSGDGCYSITPPRYELVAGHHRLLAFARLGRAEIPAIVRHLSDAEAARQLTTDNSTRKNLVDWELYKHMVMLREAKATKNNTDLARVLNVSRTVVQFLDGFGLLPPACTALLDANPRLVGYNLAQALRPYCTEQPERVIEALQLLAADRLTQSTVPGWIERKIAPRQPAGYRTEVRFAGGAKLVVTRDGAKISGNIDYAKLQALVEANLAQLIVNTESNHG